MFRFVATATAVALVLPSLLLGSYAYAGPSSKASPNLPGTTVSATQPVAGRTCANTPAGFDCFVSYGSKTTTPTTMGPNETALRQSHSALYNYLTDHVGGPGAQVVMGINKNLGLAAAAAGVIGPNNPSNPGGGGDGFGRGKKKYDSGGQDNENRSGTSKPRVSQQQESENPLSNDARAGLRKREGASHNKAYEANGRGDRGFNGRDINGSNPLNATEDQGAGAGPGDLTTELNALNDAIPQLENAADDAGKLDGAEEGGSTGAP
jgi:hypothetical protein